MNSGNARDRGPAPIVSILLPSLNQNRFLQERFESIFSQSLTDWELLVNDGFSDDGSWETIAGYAARDRRIQAWQTPRRGPYQALNDCQARARGNYIYIATADDTMRTDALKEMVAALEEHSECDICHCRIRFIDEEGKDLRGRWENLPVPRFFGSLLDVRHIRYAPHDGLLHASGYTAFTSLAQLLVRRTVFERFGGFRSDWGPVGDFEWGMRVGLVCNILHLPMELATWRHHRRQLTALNAYGTAAFWSQYIVMIGEALETLKKTNPDFYRKLNHSRLTAMPRFRLISWRTRSLPRKSLTRYTRLFSLAIRPRLAFEILRSWPRPNTNYYVRCAQREMERLGVPPPKVLGKREG